MRQKLVKKTAASSIVKFVKNGITPFTERPSVERRSEARRDTDDNKLGASDLFSLFTADIIREKTLFTR